MNCPDHGALVDCLIGRCAPTDIDVVLQHVESCPTCQQRVESLDTISDDVLNSLRVSDVDLAISPACEFMMSRAEQLPASFAHLPEQMPPPTQIREYQLLEPIGEGGMGALYRAVHTRLKREVAVKLLATRQMNDETAVNRFRREMEAVGQLEHPNIVRAFDAGDQDGTHYLVMELVEGLDLRQVLKRSGRLSVADVCEVIRQAAEGLHYAHQQGLVHRDVKPSNLMIASGGVVKVLDLGLALLNSDLSSELTSAQLAMGSVDYMAPEQADDSHHVDTKADIYSLGCTFYHLLCGIPPHGKRGQLTLLQRIKAHATEDVPPVTQWRNDVPLPLIDLLDKMLSKLPEARPANAAEIARVLLPYAKSANLDNLLLDAIAGRSQAGSISSEPTVVSTGKNGRDSASQDRKSASGSQSTARKSTDPPLASRVSTHRQRELLSVLTELVEQRAQAETGLHQHKQERDASANTNAESERTRATEHFTSTISELKKEYRTKREAVIGRFETDGYELLQEEEKFGNQATRRHAVELEEAKHVWQVKRERALEHFENHKPMPGREFAAFKQTIDGFAAELKAADEQAHAIIRRRKCITTDALRPEMKAPGDDKRDCLKRFQEVLPTVRQNLQDLHNRRVARFLEEGWPVLLFIFTSVLAVYPMWLLLQDWLFAVAAAIGVGIVVGATVRQVLRPIGRRHTQGLVLPYQQVHADATTHLTAALRAAKEEAENKQAALVARRDKEVSAADADWEQTREDLKTRHENRVKEKTDEYRARRKEMTGTHDDQLAKLEAEYPSEIQRLETEFEQTLQQLEEHLDQELIASRQDFEQNWARMVQQWNDGTASFETEIDQMNDFCDSRFPDWRTTGIDSMPPSLNELSALRIGEYVFSLDKLEHGQSELEELKSPRTEFSLPAALSYPDCPSLLLEASGEGRAAATQSLQNVMLRLLTSLPPGKARFTIIDPIGLGQNFSAFMHLADFDDRLVTNRIWTEGNHINQRLVDLTEHMENVIQKYLRNEFESIQQYNRHAGEVAEPFHILVVANFPANFSDEAARRLISIASSGARCGVYTLISADMRMKLPRNFDLADLESHALTLQWDDGKFRFQHDDLRPLPLTLETPPDDERFTSLVRAVGQQAKDSSRVEVPFETVVAPAGQWWKSDSRFELEVALGRAGATKLQTMRLGKGTSQHVLISGKTGSGKSTLLHALITNLAVHYSPDEVQFYLIDFKKGVEFKPYATHSLPHARVIAIESEREFGMSVLQRLDSELRQRGDLFRDHGVQDVAGFRDANPDTAMPRVLLIIDEFQEFFTSDDRIAHDASLLLDRLVRQGRAFGIHVLLGSQTLAGAYSLARSTIGQMAVRVALQCSEADAHLILSEDNTAARLLNRPGEAIYNDANGLLEGNHPFQVVWLSDSSREAYLRRISELAAEKETSYDPPIVFEGNVAADPSKNQLLCKILAADRPTTSALAPHAWLGAAVAIKDAAAVTFHRQSSKNLLIVGQQEEMTQGILVNCLVSLAAQQTDCRRPIAADGEPLHRFYLFDGSRPDASESNIWRRLEKRLPIDVAIENPRTLSATLGKLGDEVDRRMKENDETAEPIFVVIYNLSRFRDLKKADDFSFSSFGDDDTAVTADKRFATILREGPAYGMHILIWCDTYNNASRWLDRQLMHDLEMRVIFQMSATDSSNLMDSPAAGQLGVHRAILYSEELGQFEKFRPYGSPTTDWLQFVGQRLSADH